MFDSVSKSMSVAGIFLHPLGGLTTPYFFCTPHDQLELVTPRGGQVSDRCRGSTGHFVNRPTTVCWGDTGESAAAAHPHRVEAALNLLLDKVVNKWKKLPHRGTDL